MEDFLRKRRLMSVKMHPFRNMGRNDNVNYWLMDYQGFQLLPPSLTADEGNAWWVCMWSCTCQDCSPQGSNLSWTIAKTSNKVLNIFLFHYMTPLNIPDVEYFTNSKRLMNSYVLKYHQHGSHLPNLSVISLSRSSNTENFSITRHTLLNALS